VIAADPDGPTGRPGVLQVHGGTITAAVFLSEFAGDVPWAHLDIAPTMNVDADESWRPKGATGFGTRLLIELATTFNWQSLPVTVERLAWRRRMAGHT
jgi:hypothetical protein